MQAHFTSRGVLALAALVLTMTMSVRAQAVDVSGDWIFQVQTGMGSGTPAISFKQDGEALTGTYAGTLGNAVFTGTIKGNAIAFSFEVETQGQTIDVNYKGTVAQGTMTGEVTMAGGQVTGTFAGTRK